MYQKLGKKRIFRKTSHCVKSVRIRSYTSYTSYLSVFSPNAGKCRKNADQNNSEYGNFLHSVKDPTRLNRVIKRYKTCLLQKEELKMLKSVIVKLFQHIL